MGVKRRVLVALVIATVLVNVLFAISASNAPPHLSGDCGFVGTAACPEGVRDGLDIHGVLVLWGTATAALVLIWWDHVGSTAWRRRRRRRTQASRAARGP